MATLTANLPINGAELKQIILTRISDALDRDCTLGDDVTYSGFEIKFVVNLKYKNSFNDGTLVWGTGTTGDVEDDTDGKVETVSAGDEYESNSPAQARDDHDLPHPVLKQTADGNAVIERVMLPKAKIKKQ